MKLQRILPFAKQLLQVAVQEGDIVVDATIGNGHDTVFLAKLVGAKGHVFGFDIQEEAVKNTTIRLHSEQVEKHVTIHQKGHQHIKATIPTHLHGTVSGAIFNLGYLPGGDQTIVTIPETTISAIEQLLEIMKPEGIIVIVIYHGHQEGQVERDNLMDFVKTLDPRIAHVLHYQFLNKQNNPPFIVAIEKC
jgi:16S rRNA C1402 N4-methylase RsmH